MYLVLTSQDTIGTGGYYFSSSHFTRTLETIIVEHFTAYEATRPEHTRVHIVLFKMLRKYSDGIGLNSNPLVICFNGAWADSLWFLEPLPNARQFASLILLCAVLNQLPPRIQDSGGRPIWTDTSDFAIDHGFALTYVKKIADVLRPVDTYQKRRIVRLMQLQWGICQELYRWGVKTYGPTVMLRSRNKLALDIPGALSDLLNRHGTVAAAMEEHDDAEEGEKDLLEL